MDLLEFMVNMPEEEIGEYIVLKALENGKQKIS